MQITNDKMMPGDVLEYRCPKTEIVFQWRVVGIYLGSLYQESLIEIEGVTRSPGADSSGRAYERMMVPEPMIRQLRVLRK